jgi:ankyrin repeat protein
MFRTSRSTTTTTFSSSIDDNEIISALVTGNITTIKRLVKLVNANNYIDKKNNYTALHYAVSLKFPDIIKFLLDTGANPDVKNGDGKDCYELASEANKKILFDYSKKKDDDVIYTLHTRIDTLNTKNNDLQDKITYLNKSNDEYVTRVGLVTSELKIVKQELKTTGEELVRTKRKLSETTTAFENLLKKK